MDKKIQEYCSKILSALAKKAAKRDANSCCSYITYQPKLPEAVKKLIYGYHTILPTGRGASAIICKRFY